MKISWNKLFSFFDLDNEYIIGQRDKIEYIGCKTSGESCMNYLPEINNCFRESERFYRARDFNRAIDALEKAYKKAGELNDPHCLKCSLFFKVTVVQSLESIHIKLGKMPKGLFSSERYQTCYIKADVLLKKMRAPKEIKPAFTVVKKNSALQPAYTP